MFEISWDAPAPPVAPTLAQENKFLGKTSINFSNAPLQPNFHVDFGESKPKKGCLKKELGLKNCTRAAITVELEKFPKLESLAIGKTRWEILPGETIDECITWEPSQEGKFREKLVFVHEAGGRKRRVEVILYGHGLVTNKSKRMVNRSRRVVRKPRTRTISTTSSKSSGVLTQVQNTNVTVIGNALKPARSIPTKKPGVAKVLAKRKAARASSKENVNSDEQGEMQARLLPKKRLRLSTKDDIQSLSQRPTVKRKVLYDKLWMVKQEQGFQTWLNYLLTPSHDESITSAHAVLAQKQRHAAILRQAFRLSSSPGIEAVQIEVEREIASSGLRIRKDKELFKDLGLRNFFLDMLCCYNPIWLRLGLETITGQSVESYGVKHLRKFIESRILNDPDIENKYKETKKGLFENEEYTGELRVFTLRHFLMLVFFLDNAKLNSLIDHPSCLFMVDNKMEIKSSQAMLITFAKEFLGGEGNVLRHLAQSCSYKVFHHQQKLDEFDFQVTNLSTDLRNGIRLTRVVELLTANKERSLSRKLRLPAVSRLQKLHNVGVAFGELDAQGLDLSYFESKSVKKPIIQKDIVDGNRGKTLVVLWKMIVRWKLSMIVSEKELQIEISAVQELHGNTAKAILARSEAEQQHQEEVQELELTGSYLNGDTPSAESAELEKCILRWAQVVCAHHGVAVSNFTSSMANGVAIAALIKHYHPRLVDFSQISKGVEALAESSRDRRAYLAGLESERRNFGLINSGVEALGCIPLLLPEFDSDNIPEKKLMVLFLAYLGSRLISARDEIRAAQKIQSTWAKWSLHRKRAAVLCIQRNVRPLIKMWRQRTVSAVLVLQRSFRRSQAETKRLKFRHGVVAFEALVRGHLSRLHNNPRKDIITVQSACRTWLATRRFVYLYSVRKAQSLARGFLERKRWRELNQRATKLQAWFRAHSTCRMFNGVKELVAIVQSVVRRHRASMEYARVKRVTIRLQSILRLKWRRAQAATALQRQARRLSCMRRYERTLRSVVLLQSCARRWPDRQRFAVMKKGCIEMQALFRGMHDRRFNNPRVQLILVQSFVRQVLAKFLSRRLVASRKIQTWYRCGHMKQQYTTLKSRSVQIQAWFRGRRVLSFAHVRAVVVRCQAQARMVAAVQRFRTYKKSATKIAATARMASDRAKFLSLKRAAIALQLTVRVRRKELRATMIQASVRQCLDRKRFVNTINCVVKIQSCARRKAVLVYCSRRYHASVRIQSVFRGTFARTHHNPIAALSVLQRNARMWVARSNWLFSKALYDSCPSFDSHDSRAAPLSFDEVESHCYTSYCSLSTSSSEISAYRVSCSPLPSSNTATLCMS